MHHHRFVIMTLKIRQIRKYVADIRIIAGLARREDSSSPILGGEPCCAVAAA